MATVVPITESKPESLKDLIKLHDHLFELISSPSLSGGTSDSLCHTVGKIRFDIAKTPAKTAQDVAAKALFFIQDYVDVGPCDEFADAMRASLQEDYLRLGGVA